MARRWREFFGLVAQANYLTVNNDHPRSAIIFGIFLVQFSLPVNLSIYMTGGYPQVRGRKIDFIISHPGYLYISAELELRRPNKGHYRLDRLLQRKAKEGVMVHIIL